MQNVERGHQGGVGGRITVEVDLASVDGASDAVFELAHVGFSSATGVVIGCFA